MARSRVAQRNARFSADSTTGKSFALTGDAELAPLNANARLAFRATVEVRIPLVGAKVENFIGNQLVELLIAEQRFTTLWIAENF